MNPAKRGRPPTLPAGVRAEAVLAFVRKFRDEHGYSPTIREIAEGCSINSTSQVDLRLRELRTAGKVNFQDGQPRTIVVLE